KKIANATWQAIRQHMMANEVEVTPEAARSFLSLMARTPRLGDLLRQLHELRVLDKLLQGMAHARCLLQFNRYHKYTVDEHSIRAVEEATHFVTKAGPLGDAYRSINDRTILHLALLVHDLGKGFTEDHSEVGRQMALETARRLQLSPRDADTLEFLVHKHLVMSHLAFWR
ncbi:MAG: HD domain-containing protein, partial [Planctomycetales bacterium]|nr:HD domain-containing protein [Planctomycetales bacterium]